MTERGRAERMALDVHVARSHAPRTPRRALPERGQRILSPRWDTSRRPFGKNSAETSGCPSIMRKAAQISRDDAGRWTRSTGTCFTML